MTILSTELIGTVAGTLTTLAFVPQVLKAWRTQSVGDLSFVMLAAFTTGVGLWVIYGLAKGATSLVVANVVTLCLASILLGLKIRALFSARGAEPQVGGVRASRPARTTHDSRAL